MPRRWSTSASAVPSSSSISSSGATWCTRTLAAVSLLLVLAVQLLLLVNLQPIEQQRQHLYESSDSLASATNPPASGERAATPPLRATSSALPHDRDRVRLPPATLTRRPAIDVVRPPLHERQKPLPESMAEPQPLAEDAPQHQQEPQQQVQGADEHAHEAADTKPHDQLADGSNRIELDVAMAPGRATSATNKRSTVPLAYNVHVFYYAWYGAPSHADKQGRIPWLHWNHKVLPDWRDRNPPNRTTHNPLSISISISFI